MLPYSNQIQYAYFALSIPLSGFLFSLSLSPVSSGLAGLGSLLLLVGLARMLYRSNVWILLFVAWLTSLSFQLFAFYWIPGTIQTYAGTTREAATVYSILYSVVYQLRVFILFGGLVLSFRHPTIGPLLAGLSAFVGDRWAPQVFNWYWGNMAVGWEYWSQLASLAGVYAVGVALVMLARFLYDSPVWAHALLSWYREAISERGAAGGRQKRKNKGHGPAAGGASFVSGILDYWMEPYTLSKRRPLEQSRSREPFRAAPPFRFGLFAAYPVLFGAILLYGWQHVGRIDHALLEGEDRHRLRIAMLQTATSERLMNSITDYEHAARSMNSVVQQALESIYRSGASLDLIILPESAIPYHGVSPGEEVYSVTMHSLISYMHGVSNTAIVYNQLQKPDALVYNTASLIDPGKAHIQHYRKRVLIPYGEYLPFEDYVPALRSFFPDAGRYSPQQMDQSLTMTMTYYPARPRLQMLSPVEAGIANPETVWTRPGDALRSGRIIFERSAEASGKRLNELMGPPATMEFALLICYEDLIPELSISAFREDNPDFIVNISNDSWLHGPRAMQQHYGAARFRAIESGRFLLRSTLTGVSGIVDPAGRDFTESSSIDERGTILERVPVQAKVDTVYAGLGDLSILLLGLLLLLPCVIYATILWLRRAR